jgi:hypothetical protein
MEDEEMDSTNPQLQRSFSHVERAAGIEAALSAWLLTVCQGALAKVAEGTSSGTGAVSGVNEPRPA